MLDVRVASELLEPALHRLARALLDERLFDLRANLIDGEGTGILPVLREKQESAFRGDQRFAAFALLEGENYFAEFFAQVGAALPAPIAPLGLAGVLAVLAGEVAEVGPGVELSNHRRGLGFQRVVVVLRRAGDLNQAKLHAILLIKAFLVLVVVSFDADRAHGAAGFRLLAAHEAVDHVLLDFLAIVLLGDAAGAEVGEVLAAITVELRDDRLGELVVDVAGRDAAFLVLVEFLHDQDAIDEVLNDVFLQGLELFVEFLLVAAGALDFADERANFATDVVNRDYLFFSNGHDPVGVALVKIVARSASRLGLRTANRCEHGAGSGEEGDSWPAKGTPHEAGRLCKKVIISFNLARGVGAVKRGNRLLSWMKSSRRPELRRHFKRLPVLSTERMPFCSARTRISVTSSKARTASPNLPKRSRSSCSRSFTCFGVSARASRR